jgi:NTE family protein
LRQFWRITENNLSTWKRKSSIYIYFPGRFVFAISLAVYGIASTLSACSVISTHEARNELKTAETRDRETNYRYLEEIQFSKLDNGVFVGVALSGGGARAANFSLAALLELERFGIIKHTSTISSVSGGSLAASYYGLARDNPTVWNESNVREKFRTNFELKWLARIIRPDTAAKLIFTNFNRSQAMAEVFDDTLFQGATFASLPPRGPKILLNATLSAASNQRFTFSQEGFDLVGSRIESYPLSYAAMASGAFPGAFRDITLEGQTEQKKPGYLHLMDGGPYDNLGVTTLATDLGQAVVDNLRQGKQIKGCFLIVVDAFSRPLEIYRDKHSVDVIVPGLLTMNSPNIGNSGPLGWLIDSNIFESSDLLLRSQHVDLLSRLGYSGIRTQDTFESMLGETLIDAPRNKPVTTFYLREFFKGDTRAGSIPPDFECTVWVLGFDRIYGLATEKYDAGRNRAGTINAASKKQGDDLIELFALANSIPTRYALQSPDHQSPVKLQDALFSVAHVLVNDDPQAMVAVCSWFSGKGMEIKGCQDRHSERR